MRSTINEEQVRALFPTSSKECDVLIGLMKLAIPDWNKMVYVLEGQPRSVEGGWRTIQELFCDFNENHPGQSMFPGGLWLRMGFSMDKNLGHQEIDISEMKFILKDDQRSCEIECIQINTLNSTIEKKVESICKKAREPSAR